jgi:long-chain acyl-CoA synthetase
MISHRSLLAMAAGVTEVDRVQDTDDIVSFLPLSWVGEQLLSVAIALHAGATVNFPEAPATVREDLREIGPDVMIAPPRFWATMCSEYRVKIADASRLKRAAARVALAVGMRAAERRLRRQPVGLSLRLLEVLAWLLTFRALRDRLGLSRVRHAYTGGAPLGPELYQFFSAIGLDLKPGVRDLDDEVRPETVA